MDRLNDREETVRFGREFATRVKPGDVIALRGDLGAGKTTFVQGLLQGLEIQDTATSPTFTYLHVYDHRVYHFDLYRLSSEREFAALGFDEFFNENHIVIIEWPERIESFLPPKRWELQFTHTTNGRTVMVQQ